MPDNDTFLRRNSIIVVQEDEASRDRIVEQLTREVTGVIAIGSAADCNTLLMEEDFALAVIDEILSDESGFVLARNIRTKTGIPVLMLLGEDSHDKRLAGYLAGAIGCMDRGDALTELPPLVANILDVEIKKKGPSLNLVGRSSANYCIVRLPCRVSRSKTGFGFGSFRSCGTHGLRP